MPFSIHFLTLLLFPICLPPSVPSYFLQPYSFLPHLTFYIPLNFLTCIPNSSLFTTPLPSLHFFNCLFSFTFSHSLSFITLYPYSLLTSRSLSFFPLTFSALLLSSISLSTVLFNCFALKFLGSSSSTFSITSSVVS